MVYINGKKYHADGYDASTKTIYEFHGIFFHGHPDFFDPNKIMPIKKEKGVTFGELYEKTLQRDQDLRDAGYNLVVMWEHDWDALVKKVVCIQRKWRAWHAARVCEGPRT